jgi:CBS domain-containing protein
MAMERRAEYTGRLAWIVEAGRGGNRGERAVSGHGPMGGLWHGEGSRVFPLPTIPLTGQRVGDLPSRPIPVIAAHLPMAAARKVAALKQIALLLVERDDQIVGVIDERSLATAPDAMAVSEALKPLALSLRPSMSLARAQALFIAARAAVLPVVAGGFVLGAIARGEIEREIHRATEATRSPDRQP